MKKLLFLIFAASLIFGGEYEVVVATLRHKSGIEKIKKEFKDNKIFVYRKGEFFVVSVGSFDEDEVDEELKKIKKLYPSAFKRVIKKRVARLEDKEKKGEDFIIQIAVLSKKEGIRRIKKTLSDIDVKVSEYNGFYKIYAAASSKKEAYTLLKRIRKFYPSAFIAGEKKGGFGVKKAKKKEKYIIFVGTFDDKNSSVLLDFANEESYVKKENGLNYFYIVNVKNFSEAERRLSEIKRRYPFAKIVTSLEEKIEPVSIKKEIFESKEREKESFEQKSASSEVNETNATRSGEANETAIETAEENRTKEVEEVMSGEFKSVGENNESENQNEKIEEEVIEKRYMQEEEKTPAINSEIIRRVRKNYMDIAKPADEVYK